MSKVYIVNKGAHSYVDAERFGELVFCTEGMIDAYDTGEMYRIFAGHFNDSSPEDYILMTSLNILCSVACATFGRKHGRLNLLLFKNGAYIERHIELDNLLPKGPAFLRSGEILDHLLKNEKQPLHYSLDDVIGPVGEAKRSKE